MRFLVDASLPRAVARRLARKGLEAIDVRDVGLGSAADPHIAARAQSAKLCLISADFDFTDIRIYPPEVYFGIIVIDRSETARIADILAMIDRLVDQPTLMRNIERRLVIVGPQRIRVRPALPDPD